MSPLESLLFSCILFAMNKRAKKRVKEAIEKENLERAKVRKEQTLSSSKEQPERRGFTAKPEKKRG
jgi:hypothetical protein